MDEKSLPSPGHGEPRPSPNPSMAQSSVPATQNPPPASFTFQEHMSSFERATIRWAKAAVFMSALAALFVCAQWYEMHMGGEDTHALAVSANTQATKLGNMSDATDKIKQSAQDMVFQDQRIADNAKHSLDASNRQNKAVLDATIRNNQLDQRAWVGVLDAVANDFTETEGIAGTVIFFNSGKTPARDVQTSIAFVVSPTPLTAPPPNLISQLTFRPAQAIAPQGRYNLAFGEFFAGEQSTQAQLEGSRALISRYKDIKAKSTILYLYGILKYDDAFGNHRQTKYCLYLADPDRKRIGYCDGFNDIE